MLLRPGTIFALLVATFGAFVTVVKVMAMTVFFVLGGVFVLFKMIDIYLPPAPIIQLHQNTIGIIGGMTSAITKVVNRAKQGLNQAYHVCEPGPSSCRRVRT